MWKKLSFLLFLLPLIAAGQDKQYARKLMDTLCSPQFSGRGYVCNGDNIAAQFIRNKFHEAGLNQVKGIKEWFQNFSFQVNTFPGKVNLWNANGELLKTGVDYIVEARSAGCKASYYHIYNVGEQFKPYNPSKYQKAYYGTRHQLDSFRESHIIAHDALIVEYDTSRRFVWTVSTQKPDGHPHIITHKELEGFIYCQIDQRFVFKHNTQNVVGEVIGSQFPDSFIVLGAHYDHLGRMGCETYFPGANDNASGTAMLIDFARFFAKTENKPRYSILFVAFAGEEAGLIGSHYFVEHPLVPLKNISFMLNMDLMSNGQDGVMVVNGKEMPGYFHRLEEINAKNGYLSTIKSRGKAANSDHYWFYEKGVKSFFFYLLGSYPYYHSIDDTPEKPTYAGYNGAFSLIRDFIQQYNQPSQASK